MRFKFSGRLRFRLQTVLLIFWSGLYVALRRLFRGPHLPSWSLLFEASTYYQKKIYRTAYRFKDIQDAREFIDALVVEVPSLKQVRIEPVSSPIKGAWFRLYSQTTKPIILYFHGAYAFFARAERNLIADMAIATELPVFALEYRLTPEYPFPAQLNDALAAYDWLLESGYQGTDIILMGTSAGGNLGLSFLLELVDLKRPLPALTVGICPWTAVDNSGASVDKNEPFDTLDRSMIALGAQWLVGKNSPRDPQISPIHADLHGLPPIYLQAGGREIFIDMIRSFHQKAKTQGVDIKLDVWESMNHVFQAYGDQLPEAQEALQRIATIVHRDPAFHMADSGDT